MSKTILLASNNQHKLTEFKALLKDSGYQLISLEQANCNLGEAENGLTYQENALAKVKELQSQYDGFILADDSGIEISALDYQPGIYSARFMPEYTQKEKNKEIVFQLKFVDDRHARFVCALALSIPGQPIWVDQAICEGVISKESAGVDGFGYDPIFIPNGYVKTFAQMEPELKNQVSHRGLAVKKLLNQLNKEK